MSQSIAILSDRAVFEITGADAPGFLQGLVTSDLEPLTSGQASHAGLLTPQGKIMFDFFALRQDDGFLVDCPASQIDDLVKRLTFYKLRAQVDIAVRPEQAVAAVWGGDTPPDTVTVFADPRLVEMGWRIIGQRTEVEALSNTTQDAYDRHRIALGVPDSVDIGTSQTFPHEANFDQLGGVSFTKGCYVGQEVVSRMQHRGTARSRIVPVRFDGEMNETGAEIRAGGKKIGQMLSVVSGQGLALVRLDRAKSASESGVAIEADGKALTLIKPQWATFDM